MNNNFKDCTPFEKIIEVEQLAVAYVPFQELCGIYDENESMIKGTIFPELARPYCKLDKSIMKGNNSCNQKK